jgi:hypothetical protein
MKKTLQIIFENNKQKYPDFLKLVEKESSATQWGIGIMSAYSIIPYYSEMLGCKQGRMLKNESTPGKNKQRYNLNNQGKIISETEFVNFNSRKNYWLTVKRFFAYKQNHIVEFCFSSASDHGIEAKLDFVKLAKTKDNLTVSCYMLNSDNEYTRLDYNYTNKRITTINQQMWLTENLVANRSYDLHHANTGVIITETLPDGNTYKIFPTK